ncbi:hypothetical protein [Methylopila sp. M107]|uniref:hypothetical protein n=1 Tax=Methylopila sp. M107 TaxID=1101190 RepID=UPI000368265D|nr:hypothetical protein [Methylopila sp. M107]
MTSNPFVAGIAALALSAGAAMAAGVPEELIGLWDEKLKLCREGMSDSALFVGPKLIGFHEEFCDIRKVEAKGDKTEITSKCTPNELSDDGNSYLWTLDRRGDRLFVSLQTIGKKKKPTTFSLPYCREPWPN